MYMTQVSFRNATCRWIMQFCAYGFWWLTKIQNYVRAPLDESRIKDKTKSDDSEFKFAY